MQMKRIKAMFYRNEQGKEPVRDWLRELGKPDSTLIGTDIMTVEFGWPIGMPVCKPLGKGLYEVRTELLQGRIARTLFFISEDRMILLHGFVKKTKKTPKRDIELALRRKALWEA